MEKNIRELLNIVCSGITGNKTNVSNDLAVSNHIAYVEKHHIHTLFFYGLFNNNIELEENMKNMLETRVYSDIMINERQLHLIDELKTLFNDNNIDFMLLKGSVLKELYPKPEIRRMGDIDILIRVEQYHKIVEIMKNAKFERLGESDHELKWTKSGILIELHSRLIPSYNKDFYAYFGDGWEKVKHKGKNEYVLKNEDMFIYLFTHFAKHYRDAGIGIIHMCDLWIFLNTYNLNYKYISKELCKMGLDVFFENILKTIKVWFENGKESEMTDFITITILNSGVYGLSENHALSTALKNRQKNKILNRVVKIVRMIFPSYKNMRNKYLILFKIPFLFPVFWPIRWVELLFRRTHRIKSKIIDFQIATDENIDQYKEMLEYVGLRYNFK